MKKTLILMLILSLFSLASCGNKENKKDINKKNNNIEQKNIVNEKSTDISIGGEVEKNSASESNQDTMIDNLEVNNVKIADKDKKDKVTVEDLNF